MSRSAYASSLRTLGVPYKTRSSASVGGSGSDVQPEEAGSTAPSVEVDRGNDTGRDGAALEVAQVNPAPTERHRKRHRTLGTKTPRTINVPRDEIEEDNDVEAAGGKHGGEPIRGSGLDRVGNYSITEVAKMMAGIPSKPYWKEMKGSGLNAVMQKCCEHWGQVSSSSHFSI